MVRKQTTLRVINGGEAAAAESPATRYVSMQVEGDSMEPTFHHGDLVLVREDERQAPTDGLWVLRWSDAVGVKRCAFRDGTVLAFSDNERYAPMAFDLADPPHGFELVGRVVAGPR